MDVEALNLRSESSIPLHDGVPHVAGLVGLSVTRQHAGLLQPQGHGVALGQPHPGLES